MPLTKALNELLATIEDEKDRGVLREQLEKHTPLQERFEGNLRQSDYDRMMNSTKAEREKEKLAVEEARANAEKWQKWADENVPKHNDLLEKYKTVEQERVALEEKVKAAATTTTTNGEQVDANELMKRVDSEINKRGYMTQAEIGKLVNDQARKIADEERNAFFKETLPGVMKYTIQVNQLHFKHRDEFKEPLDFDAFAKFQAEQKIADPEAAYNQFVADKRVEMRVQSAVAAKERELQTKFNLPGTGAPPAPQLGVLEARQRAGNKPIDENAPAWVQAAAELRTEGKG